MDASLESLSARVQRLEHGLVVAPGFIDLHQHAQDAAAYRVEVADGTTTALELEEGPADVASWYAARAAGALINYGAGVGHVDVRKKVMHDTLDEAPVGAARNRDSTKHNRCARGHQAARAGTRGRAHPAKELGGVAGKV